MAEQFSWLWKTLFDSGGLTLKADGALWSDARPGSTLTRSNRELVDLDYQNPITENRYFYSEGNYRIGDVAMNVNTDPGGLSARSRRDLVILFGAGQRTVTVEDAAEALGVTRNVAARRLSAWAANGWLRRVRRGLYLSVPVDARDPVSWNEDPWYLADVVWNPCYIAGWSAANHWGALSRAPRPLGAFDLGSQ